MDKLEILNTKLTAINDEIRDLSGSEEKLGLDAMAENVRSGNDEITVQTQLLERAVAELQGKVDPELYDKGYAEGEIKGKAEGEQIGYDKALAEGYIKPSGTLEITENNKEYDVTEFEKASVVIPIQSKLPQVISGTETEITADDLAGATKIEQYSFYKHYNLESMEIPEGVESIGSYAINQCSALKNITLPQSLLTLGSNCLCNLAVESIVIPPKVTALTNYSLQTLRSLKGVVLPEGLLTIGNSVFAQANALQKVTIPSTVTTIGSSVFSFSALEEMILLPTTPPTIQPFHSALNYVKFYVPAESVEAYKNATNWSAYADRIFAIEE